MGSEVGLGVGVWVNKLKLVVGVSKLIKKRKGVDAEGVRKII